MYKNRSTSSLNSNRTQRPAAFQQCNNLLIVQHQLFYSKRIRQHTFIQIKENKISHHITSLAFIVDTTEWWERALGGAPSVYVRLIAHSFMMIIPFAGAWNRVNGIHLARWWSLPQRTVDELFTLAQTHGQWDFIIRVSTEMHWTIEMRW